MASEHSTSDNQRLSSEEELTIDHLAHLQEIVREVAPKCYDFGLQLGVEDHEIQVIRAQYPNLHDQLREILRNRLKQLPLLTWKDIVRALQTKTVGMNHLASVIQSQYRHKDQSIFVQCSMSASPQVTSTHQPTAPPLLTHYSTSQSTLQPSPLTLSARLQPLPQPYFPAGSRSSQAAHPHYLQTDASSHPPPHPPTSTPSQPQAEAVQPPSSSQPSSSQLVSVPVTSQAMPGPSPQLSQDVATPHPLQVGEQQALQGQPPLQHIPSHQPQTVAQSHGAGSQGLLSQQTPQPAATSFPVPPQATHLPLHGLQPTPSLQQVSRQPVTTPTSTAVQQSTVQQDLHPYIPWRPWAEGGTPSPHTYMYSVTQWPPGPLQLSSQHPLPSDSLSSNQLNISTVAPLTITTHNPPRPQTHNQPLGPYTNSSFGQLMSVCNMGLAVSRPHTPPVLSHHFAQYINQPPPNPQLSWGQGMATPHHLPQAVQQAIQGLLQLQHVSSHEPYGASPASFPQAKRARYESSMAQYIDYIKSVYKESVLNELSVVKWPPTPSKVYINLVCVDRTTHVSKQEVDECTRAMVCHGSVDVVLGKKTPIDFSDIAKNVPTTKRNERRVILVEGAPGVGKSTLAGEFCRMWERGEIAQQYKLVVLLRLRDKGMSEAQSLADLLYHPSKAVVQAVEDELLASLGAYTLIILEGFDELPSTCRTESSVFLRLINGTLLPHATVLVTSRPWATRDIHWKCCNRIFQHIEILGFTSKQIEEYVTSVFMDEENVANDKAKENIEEVMSYITSFPQIKSCMYIPLNSAIVVSVYQESKAGRCILPQTLTELYLALTQALLLRYLYGHPEYSKKDWEIQSLEEDLPLDVYSKLLALSELAYSGICTDQSNRDSEGSRDEEGSVQLIYNLSPGFETLGLMQSVPQLYVTRGVVTSYHFLHLTVQEFLAALHISNMSPEKQLEHLQKGRGWKEEGRWRVVLRFLAGITKLANLSPEDLKGLLLDKPNEDHITACRRNVHPVTPDVVLSSEHVHWMFETQRDDIVPLVLQEKTVEFRCQEGLTPLDYYSLGYCIVHSHCQWVLTRKDDEIGEEKVRMLVAGTNTRCDTSARVVGLRGERRAVFEGGGHRPLSISAEALHTLFTGLENVIHLQELHLILPVECSGVRWPDLSGLRVLHITISDTRNWRLDTLLPHLLLQSLTIESTSGEGGLVADDVACIGELFLSSNCPKHVTIIDQRMSSITAEVAVGQHVHEKQFANRTSVVEANKILENRVYHPDWYLMGYVIAHSNFQWMLAMQHFFGQAIEEEKVRMLVDGTNTRHGTSARVVGLRGGQRNKRGGGGHSPLLISAEVLHTLFTELENVIHLQELHLKLPDECSRIPWPDLSGLRVMRLGISGKRNWRLDTLLPLVPLESFEIEAASDDTTVVLEDCVAIGMLLSSSNCLKCLHFQGVGEPVTIDPQGMESITKALSDSKYLPLRSVVMECKCTFSDTAAHSLAQFIKNTATLHHLSLWWCTFSAHGLLELAQAIHHSSSLQERKLERLICTVDGDDEATDCAQLLHHYSHMVYSALQWSHITDRGAEPIGTALRHNSTLVRLDLPNSSIGDAGSTALAQALLHNSTLLSLSLSNNGIGDAGSTALAQALHHNSTLGRLVLSGNDAIGEEGTRQLVQALTVHTDLYLVLPRKCEEYATQCPQYSEVENSIQFR